MKIHRGNLNVYYEVKEAKWRRLPTVRYQLDDILEKASLQRY